MISVLGIDIGACSVRASFLRGEAEPSNKSQCTPVVDHLGRSAFPAFYCPDVQNPNRLSVGFAALKAARPDFIPRRLTPEMLLHPPVIFNPESSCSGFEVICQFLQQISEYADRQFNLEGVKPLAILSVSTYSKRIEEELNYAIKSSKLQLFEEVPCLPAALSAMYEIPGLQEAENSVILLADLGSHLRHTLIKKDGDQYSILAEYRDPVPNLLDTALKNHLFSVTALKQIKDEFKDPSSLAFFQLHWLLHEIKNELVEVDEVAMSKKIQLGLPATSWVDIDIYIDRPILLELIAPLLKRSLSRCQEMLAQKQTSHINHVILTGGQAALPAVRQAWESEFSQCVYLPDSHLFASGACRRALSLAGSRLSRPVMNEWKEKLEHKTIAGAISIQRGENRNLLIPGGVVLPYSFEEKFEFRKRKKNQDGSYGLTLLFFYGECALPDWHISGIPADIKDGAPVFLKLGIAKESLLEAELYFPSLRRRYKNEYALPALASSHTVDMSAKLGFDTRDHKRSTRGGDSGSAPVQCSLFAPRKVKRNAYFQVNLYIHRSEQEKDVRARVAEFIQIDEVQRKQNQLDLSTGSELDVVLDIPGMEIGETICKLVWRGDIASAEFLVAVPATYEKENAAGKLVLFKHGLPILTMVFILEVGSEQSVSEPLDPVIHRINQAFISYASKDRQQVLFILQGLRAGLPHVKFYMDILSLTPGEHFNQALMQAIELCDMFYLFWSKAASESHWVEKEWRYALEHKGIDYIAPIPLVAPHTVPPPPELGAHLHFNDQILAFRENANTN